MYLIRPSTPVARLMTDQFQREWLANVEKANAEREAVAKVCYLTQERTRKKHHQKKAVTHQPIVKKHSTVLEKDVNTLFKMSKFKKVPAKLSTHRTTTTIATVDHVAEAAEKLTLSEPKIEAK
jgi:hypothetical protein